MIMHITRPSAADVAAALGMGFAVEMRRDGNARYIGPKEHAIEIDALGDRILDALPIEGGARPMTELLPIGWPPADTYQEQP